MRPARTTRTTPNADHCAPVAIDHANANKRRPAGEKTHFRARTPTKKERDFSPCPAQKKTRELKREGLSLYRTQCVRLARPRVMPAASEGVRHASSAHLYIKSRRGRMRCRRSALSRRGSPSLSLANDRGIYFSVTSPAAVGPAHTPALLFLSARSLSRSFSPSVERRREQKKHGEM